MTYEELEYQKALIAYITHKGWFGFGYRKKLKALERAGEARLKAAKVTETAVEGLTQPVCITLAQIDKLNDLKRSSLPR